MVSGNVSVVKRQQIDPTHLRPTWSPGCALRTSRGARSAYRGHAVGCCEQGRRSIRSTERYMFDAGNPAVESL